MADSSMITNVNPPIRSKPFGPAKVIKKTTGLYKSKRFHIQLLLPFSIAIVSLIIGIIYSSNCPIQRYIPVYLIVQGAVGLLIFDIHLLAMVYILCVTKFKYFFICTIAILTAFLGLFLFALFIAGNIWIFSVFNRVQFDDSTNTNSYCNGVLYHAAFWLVIVQYIMAAFFCCSFTWIPQSTQSPTNGIIKVRKQIPKIKRMLKTKTLQPPTTPYMVDIRL
jgi:hypothetical protein